MMGAMLLLLLSSAGPQNAFSFRVEVLKDTFYQPEPKFKNVLGELHRLFWSVYEAEEGQEVN